MKYINFLFLSLFTFAAFGQNYEVTELTSAPYADSIQRTGKLAFKNTMLLSFKTNGFLNKLAVDDGDAFKKGDLLAALDTTELEADKNLHYAKLLQAKREVNRIEALLKKKLSSQQELDNAETNLETTRAAYQIAYYNLEKAQIIAPFDGVVLGKHTQLGELQAPGQSVLTVAALEKNWVIKVALTGDEINHVKLQQEVEVNLPNKSLMKGIVVKIPAIANTDGNLFIIDVLLPELTLTSGVTAGQLANIKINLQTEELVYQLPIDALVGVNDDGKAIVLTQSATNTFNQQYFTIYRLDNDYVYLAADPAEPSLQVVVRGWQNINVGQ